MENIRDKCQRMYDEVVNLRMVPKLYLLSLGAWSALRIETQYIAAFKGIPIKLVPALKDNDMILIVETQEADAPDSPITGTICHATGSLEGLIGCIDDGTNFATLPEEYWNDKGEYRVERTTYPDWKGDTKDAEASM